MPAGAYSVELRNGATVLGSQSFGVSFESEYGAGNPLLRFNAAGAGTPTPQANVSFVMPWAEGTTSIVLLHGATVLESPRGQRRRTQRADHQPDRAGQLDIRHDPDADLDGRRPRCRCAALQRVLQPRRQRLGAAGERDHRQLVRTERRRAGRRGQRALPRRRHRWRQRGLRRNQRADQRARQAADRRDHRPGAAGKVVAPGDLLLATGMGSDLEDGTLPDEALAWSSDRQGVLGSGPSLAVNTLQPGRHTITLTVHDSAGQSRHGDCAGVRGHPRGVADRASLGGAFSASRRGVKVFGRGVREGEASRTCVKRPRVGLRPCARR